MSVQEMQHQRAEFSGANRLAQQLAIGLPYFIGDGVRMVGRHHDRRR